MTSAATPTVAPRLLVAGNAGDAGKTLVSLALVAAWRAEGLRPAVFKKGPDYIDAAWLTRAAGAPCRNLDSYLQEAPVLLESFRRHASPTLNVVEGNRGLLDGVDLEGTHSSAALARLLAAPAVLVVSASKVTRTLAATVLGCRRLEPELDLAGVILNRVGGARHLALARRAVEELAGVPVLGALPRLEGELLPGRHLGLLPPEEHPEGDALLARLAGLAGQHLDLPRLLALARAAPPLSAQPRPAAAAAAPPSSPAASATRCRIGVFRDSAFTFYYPENLEALEHAGAELVFLSPLNASSLPEVDALYVGGGFPETHAARLAQATALHAAVREQVAAGLPVHAECGGLIFAARALHHEGRRWPMAGVLPVELELCARPQGHGYVAARVDRPNPLFAVGEELRGHEFHHARLLGGAPPAEVPSCLAMLRGVGCGGGRDGLLAGSLLASFMHLHALGAPSWAPALVERAVQHRARRG